MDKQRHTHTQFIKGQHKASLKVNSDRFKALNVIGDDLFELESGHKSIEMNLPIYLGFEILQNAKIRILSFFYDFLCKFIKQSDINCILSDTDSLYFALAHKTLKDAVHNNMKDEFQKHLTGFCGEQRHPNPYLCRECCQKHAFEDSKCPNLFKVNNENNSTFTVRLEGNLIISLLL